MADYERVGVNMTLPELKEYKRAAVEQIQAVLDNFQEATGSPLFGEIALVDKYTLGQYDAPKTVYVASTRLEVKL